MSKHNKALKARIDGDISTEERKLVGRSFAAGMLSSAVSVAGYLAVACASPSLAPVAFVLPIYIGWRRTETDIRQTHNTIKSMIPPHFHSNRDCSTRLENLKRVRNIAFTTGGTFALAAIASKTLKSVDGAGK